MGATLSVGVQDITIQGIGLLADRSFISGTSFLVEAGPSGKPLSMELTAQVRHALLLPTGRWLLGCRFSRRLTSADMDVLS